MLTPVLTVFLPSLAPANVTSRTKPYYLQAFSSFSKNIYWFFLLYITWMMFGPNGIVCDFSAAEPKENNEIAEFVCLLEDGYTVRVQDVYGSQRERPSMASVRSTVHYAQRRAHETGEIFPGISAHNGTHSYNYRFYGTFMWLDYLILFQIFLFFAPEVFWDRQRWHKEDSMFGELEWSVPDVDYEPSVEHIEDMLKTLEEQEAKFKANHNPKYESELDELFEEFAVDRTNSLPATLAQIYDPRIAKLYQIAQSKFVISLVEVILAQLACIFIMTFLWDCLLTHGSETHNFSFFGFRVLNYWIEYWKADGELPYYVDYPGEVLFPMLIKCRYPFVGASGSLAKEDYLCVIAGNYLVEKMVLLTWFYYLISIVVLLHALTVDIILPLFPHFRRRYIAKLMRDPGIPKKLQQFDRQCCLTSQHPDANNVPYQVAIFADYLARNIGRDRTAIVLKHFTIANSHLIKSTADIKKELQEMLKRKQKRTEEVESPSEGEETDDSLYEHYLHCYRRIRNYIMVLEQGRSGNKREGPMYDVSSSEDEEEVKKHLESELPEMQFKLD